MVEVVVVQPRFSKIVLSALRQQMRGDGELESAVLLLGEKPSVGKQDGLVQPAQDLYPGRSNPLQVLLNRCVCLDRFQFALLNRGDLFQCRGAFVGKLDPDLLARVRKYSEIAGYSSVEEFISHALEKELAKLEDADSEEEIRKRLKGLGYIS